MLQVRRWPGAHATAQIRSMPVAQPRPSDRAIGRPAHGTDNLRGNAINTVGEFARILWPPAFTLTGGDLGVIKATSSGKSVLGGTSSIQDHTGKPSRMRGGKVVALPCCVFEGSPFARLQRRGQNLKNVIRVGIPGQPRDYGVTIADKADTGCSLRAIVVIGATATSPTRNWCRKSTQLRAVRRAASLLRALASK